MSDEKPPKAKGGEQFSDPLSWTPDMRMPGPPSSRPIHDIDRRERDINQRIVDEYGGDGFEMFRPLIAMAIIGVVVLSQVDRSNKPQALAYTSLAMLVGGALYWMIANDSLPPFLSVLVRGAFMIGVLGFVLYGLFMHTDLFSRPLEKDSMQYRSTQDPNKDP
jgi:hypothetical protein